MESLQKEIENGEQPNMKQEQNRGKRCHCIVCGAELGTKPLLEMAHMPASAQKIPLTKEEAEKEAFLWKDYNPLQDAWHLNSSKFQLSFPIFLLHKGTDIQ